MARKSTKTYLERYSKHLKKVLDDYELNRHSLFRDDFVYFNNIESGITKFPLRPYQMDALYLVDYFFKIPNNRPEKGELLETINKEEKVQAPFLTFEMATGSGKTMLMGATIYLLNKKQGIKNFLIITPASTDIYQKTIRNFSLNNKDTVWADDTPFTFNLITGDNYKDNIDYDESRDANIFIFNISKFGTNAVNTEKMWESSIWKDDDGNNVGIKQYLKNKKLVIITDESHHAQSIVAKKIIKNFYPRAVLEYTATAVEAVKNQDKKNQQVVYRYDIRRFLEDGHGKLVRAIALANDFKKSKEDILQNERFKLATLFLIHILKKRSLSMDGKTKNLKPIAFIKVKEDTKYTEKVFDYIKNELSSDISILKIVLDKIKKQELDITDLLKELLENEYQNDLSEIATEIQKIANTSIFYHGKSDSETTKKFNEISYNEVEVVVYMQRLDEGIDMPNIYTMAVINDTESNFKTSVKQIIGRGVRLNKDKREYDDSNNHLLQQVEKLHIVCDQGKNFEEIIESIQKEFGLNDKYFSSEKAKTKKNNRVNSELLKGKYVPHIKASVKVKQGVSLMELVKDEHSIVDNYLEVSTFVNDNEKRYLKYRPNTFFVEVDVFSEKDEFINQIRTTGGIEKELVLSNSHAVTIYSIVQKRLFCLPDSKNVRELFSSYVKRINEKKLFYFRLDESDDELVCNQVVNSFSNFYRNHIEKNYYDLQFDEVDRNFHHYLDQKFKEYEISIPKDQVKNKTLEKIRANKDKRNKRDRVINLVDQNYHFYGFDKSVYEYDNFDSLPEFQLADYVDEQIKRQEDNSNYFWIRNQRNVYFSYGSKKYYPDFIVYKDGYIYVIETKGEVFSDTRKNFLLKRLDQIEPEGDIKGFRGVLIFSKQLDNLEYIYRNFDQFVKESEDILRKMQTEIDLLPDAPRDERFEKYLPVYSPAKAYRKLIKNNNSVKPDGWLEVPQIGNRYPKNVFALQVKGDLLLPRYGHNDWILLQSLVDENLPENEISAIYSNGIEDEYPRNYMLRIPNYKEVEYSGTLFSEKRVVFGGIKPEVEPIELEDNRDSFIVFAKEFKGSRDD